MINNKLAIGLIFGLTVSLIFVSVRSTRTEKQNAERFQTTGELSAPRWQVVLISLLALFCNVMAFLTDHGSTGETTWPIALMGLLGMIYVFVESYRTLRLDSGGIRFGWRYRKYVAYSEVVALERRSMGRDVIFTLILQSGARVRIGVDLPCEPQFTEALQKRTQCKLVRLPR